MTEEQAWQKFEDAMRNVESFEEAIKWLNKNPQVKYNLTVFEMMRQFNKDIREANKYYKN
jgi:ABC-type transport system involved in cytochrome c biogenesis ATPase subunit